ncbi:MAG: hypothetical protein FWH10_07235 [Oscillospiraceae bacterium]|nr:hypothetical protein [Oscillospiraceae bacterium]
MNWLSENCGARSVSPVSGEFCAQSYTDGSRLVYYDFIFSVMLDISDTTDGVNTDNMFEVRRWQNWVDEMQSEGNYPDFGVNCYDYELQNLANSVNPAQVYGNGSAKYQFPARLIYTEDTAWHKDISYRPLWNDSDLWNDDNSWKDMDLYFGNHELRS